MSLSGTRLHGQAVKTQPSHGCNRGSNPLGVTKKTRTLLRPCFFVVRIPVLRLALRPATGCTLARFALAVRRIPLESPSNQFRALFGARFLLGISPLFCVSFHDPQQAARSRASAPDLSYFFRASSLCLSLRIASCKARHRRRPRRAVLHACPAPRHRRP